MAKKSRGNMLLETEYRKSTSWVFTRNNYSEEDLKLISDLDFPKWLRYICWGKEVGAQGTPHIQGYFYCKYSISRSAVSKWLSKNFWFESAKGDCESNQAYTSKEGDWFEWGQPPAQGNRNDWTDFYHDVSEGFTYKMMIDKHPKLIGAYYNAFARARRMYLKGIPVGAKQIFIITGPTGSGKSRMVYDIEGDDHEKIWTCPIGFKGEWFDGYDGQEAVHFEEFEGEIEYRDFKRMTDRYKAEIPVKGDFAPWCPKRIYFTTTIDYTRWYQRRDLSELFRRVEEFGQIIKL